ncbi:MAG: small multi-drug export protein, partial [Planctomycetota bacterium]
RPWFAKITFLGVLLFVLFPLTGTGAIGGSLFGRLLGMKRFRTLTAIALGSALGCFAIAALARGIARTLPEEVRDSWWFEAVGIALVVSIVAVLWLRSRQSERERLAGRGLPVGEGEPAGGGEG